MTAGCVKPDLSPNSLIPNVSMRTLFSKVVAPNTRVLAL